MMENIKKERINNHTYHNVYGNNNIDNKPITQDSIIIATFALLLITAATALVTVFIGFHNLQLALLINKIGIGGVIALFAMSFFSPKMRSGSPIFGTLLALFQGAMLGGFTFSIGSMTIAGEAGWKLVGQALIGTITLFFLALFLYKAKLIRPNAKFMSFIYLACIGFGALYLVNLGITMFTGTNLLMSDGPIPIIIGAAAIILGSLSLIADFHSSDQLIISQAPDKTKWAIATAITSSLVWLYIELLRLLYLIRR